MIHQIEEQKEIQIVEYAKLVVLYYVFNEVLKPFDKHTVSMDTGLIFFDEDFILGTK